LEFYWDLGFSHQEWRKAWGKRRKGGLPISPRSQKVHSFSTGFETTSNLQQLEVLAGVFNDLLDFFGATEILSTVLLYCPVESSTH